MTQKECGYNAGKTLSIKATSLQQVGLQKGASAICEDTMLVYETPELNFYGLADGQSGKTACISGGNCCLNATKDFVEKPGLSYLLGYPFYDEVPWMLIKQIRSGLSSISSLEGKSVGEYASTLLAVAFEPKSGQYMTFHIGDGCAIAVTNDNSIIILSGVENPLINTTWLSTSPSAARHLRISYGSAAKLKRLLLLTDGARCLCHGNNVSHKGRELIIHGSQQDILDYLKCSQPIDDSSCIVLDLVS